MKVLRSDLPGVFLSRSTVQRGLHLSPVKDRGHLLQVLVGEVFAVAVDLRRGALLLKNIQTDLLPEYPSS